MATFVRIITEDSVLERIAGAAPGTLHAVRSIDAKLKRDSAAAMTVEDRDNADREHLEALLHLGRGAIAVGRLALWEGLRGFNAFEVAKYHGLDAAHDTSNSPDIMALIIEAQADRIYPLVPGVRPAIIARENGDHRERCARALSAVQAGVVDSIAWSDEIPSPIQERIATCDIFSLP